MGAGCAGVGQTREREGVGSWAALGRPRKRERTGPDEWLGRYREREEGCGPGWVWFAGLPGGFGLGSSFLLFYF